MRETVKGFWALISVCLIWGLSGIYYKLLASVPPLEVLAHRTVWSVVFFAVVLAFQGQLGALVTALRNPRQAAALALAAVLISINWFGFIWAVQNGHAMEASLGYYIFPLVAVALGMIFLRERMGRLQTLAVLIVTCAVLWLTWSLGKAPWIALTLAATFGLYGLIKKGIDLPPAVSVCAEVVLLAPFALALLIAEHFGWGFAPHSGSFGGDWTMSALLVFSGVMTGGPLMLFSYAAQRVRLATVGVMLYLNPTLQFLVAVIAFGEPLTHAYLVAFPLIWGALALYSFASLRGAAQAG